MVLSPVMCTKISGQILNFVLVNIMKPLGSRCIPIQVYTRFVADHVVMCTLCPCYQEAAVPWFSTFSRAWEKKTLEF